MMVMLPTMTMVTMVKMVMMVMMVVMMSMIMTMMIVTMVMTMAVDLVFFVCSTLNWQRQDACEIQQIPHTQDRRGEHANRRTESSNGDAKSTFVRGSPQQGCPTASAQTKDT